MEVGWAVEVSGDTSRCQTHRCTAAKDSSSQLPLEAQLDTGIRWSRERTVDVGKGGEGGETGGRQIAHDDSWLLFTCRWKVVALLLYDMTVIGLN